MTIVGVVRQHILHIATRFRERDGLDKRDGIKIARTGFLPASHPARPGIVGRRGENPVLIELLIDIFQILGADLNIGFRIEQLAGVAVARMLYIFTVCAAVAGIICIRPLAPTGERAFGFQALS